MSSGQNRSAFTADRNTPKYIPVRFAFHYGQGYIKDELQITRQEEITPHEKRTSNRRDPEPTHP